MIHTSSCKPSATKDASQSLAAPVASGRGGAHLRGARLLRARKLFPRILAETAAVILLRASACIALAFMSYCFGYTFGFADGLSVAIADWTFL